jgi:Predicted enzyme of the cupin superfamily
MRYEVTRIDSGEPASARQSHTGEGMSESRTIVDLENVSVRLGTFIAEPGEYSTNGVPVGEWFVVLEGAGQLFIDGEEPIDLGPGSVVFAEPHLPSRMVVTEKLSKVSLIGLA